MAPLPPRRAATAGRTIAAGSGGIAGLALLVCGALAAVARGESLTLTPVADTCLFEQYPENNLGAVANLPAGSNNTGMRCRMLVRFDVGAAVPAGSTVTRARLELAVTASGSVDSDFVLRRMLAPWHEGTQRGDNRGQPAGPGETTWLARAHPGELGSAPGGTPGIEFALQPSSTVRLRGLGAYSVPSTPELVADVQSWLDQPASNHGWILLTTSESVASTTKRVASRESDAGAPRLAIEYVPPPAPPRIDSITVVADEVRLGFEIEAGKLYAVQYNEAVATTNWSTLTFAASKFWPTNWVATDSRLAAPRRFYRLAILGDID